MDFYSIMGFAAAAAVTSFSVSGFNKAAGRAAAVAACAIILLHLLAAVSGIGDRLRALADGGGVPLETVSTAIKAVGIAYLTELTSALCRDLGEGSLAVVCETAGRLMLALLALPIIARIAETAIGIAEQNL